MKHILRKFVSLKPGKWDTYIWRAVLAMRTGHHKCIGRSPAELVYEQKLHTPTIWNQGNKQAEDNRIKNINLFFKNLKEYRK
ncbi:hypothetical protein AX774_g4681 [Zancudomyces culisetae]|uniref:Uncharacterized protein n=1 Tax=Zancudomyces culisetae TaxID=1213189 RepID=A0A1R1PLM0_ZANCU|nr:hypothetical protein AX774_g4681 [Zancudomyces culisetae]|eukprot:OMH81855.1 hypothetical protein AX774_g4681 [Zancudomyces culisetae]